MRLASALLLVFTSAMILVHLTSTRLLRRAWAGDAPGWLSVLNLFRFEGIYYLALMAYVVWQRGRFLLLPLLVMAALHMAGWAVAERRREWLACAGGAVGGRAFWPACRPSTSRKRWCWFTSAGCLARAILSPP